MPDLLAILESFNRKERFFLIAQALGNPGFELSTGFREKLAKAVCLDEIPASAFAWMDYHLDWLHASLVLWNAAEAEETVFSNQDEAVAGNQEDVDLLIAFNRGGQYHLILVEAKAYEGKGYASFDRSQLKSKSDRIVKIFDKAGQKYPRVTTHFCLMSQNNPKRQTVYEWPWDEARWIPVSLRDKNTRRIVERYNAKTGKSDKDGNEFHVRKLK